MKNSAELSKTQSYAKANSKSMNHWLKFLLLFLLVGLVSVSALIISDTNGVTDDSGNLVSPRTADVALCRGENTTDDTNKLLECDILILSTDSQATALTKVQTAINRVNSSGGGNINLMDDITFSGGSISFTNRENIIFNGNGHTIIANLTNPATSVFFGSSANNNEIRNLNIQCTNVSSSHSGVLISGNNNAVRKINITNCGGQGIDMPTSNYANVEDITCNRIGYACVYLGTNTNNSFATRIYSHTSGLVNSADGYGFNADVGSDNIIVSNIISYNDSKAGVGIYTKNIQLSNVMVYAINYGTDHGILLESGTDNIEINNVFCDGLADSCVGMFNTAKNAVVSNIYCKDMRDDATFSYCVRGLGNSIFSNIRADNVSRIVNTGGSNTSVVNIISDVNNGGVTTGSNPATTYVENYVYSNQINDTNQPCIINGIFDGRIISNTTTTAICSNGDWRLLG